MKRNDRTVGYLASLCLLTLMLSGCSYIAVLFPAKASKSNTVSLWFVRHTAEGPVLVNVDRDLSGPHRLSESLRELLCGPTRDESAGGLGTEIPRGTILLGIKDHGTSVSIDLSRRFATGGGSESMELRLEQLARTVGSAEPDRDVFLNIEGKRLNVTQGEGIEVKQPINRM